MEILVHSLVLLLISNCFIHSSGVFDLVPSEDVFLCPGQQLELNCATTDSDFLQWNVTIPQFNISEQRTISSSNTVGSVASLNINSFIFTFEIPSRSPLTSRLFIDPVVAALNGTTIMCTERLTAMDRSEEATIVVIETDTSPEPPVIRIVSEEFGASNVTLILDSATYPESTYSVTYDFSVAPYGVSMELLDGNSSVKLVLLYNVEYNLSVTVTLCGEANATSNIKTLKYVNCGEPTVSGDIIVSYTSTVLGSQLTFQCAEGLVPDLVITAQCTHNAAWVPNPSAHICRKHAVLTSTTTTEVSTSLTNRTHVGIGISVALVFGVLLVLLLVVIIAVVRKSQGSRNVEGQEKDIEMSRNVVYDHVKNCRKQRIELTRNDSYSTVNVYQISSDSQS